MTKPLKHNKMEYLLKYHKRSNNKYHKEEISGLSNLLNRVIELSKEDYTFKVYKIVLITKTSSLSYTKILIIHTQQILEFFRSHKELSVSGIEKTLGLTRGIIRMDGTRKISNDNSYKIQSYLYNLSRDIKVLLDK